MNKYLKLIRVQQWYKNLVVFLAIFFSGNLLNSSLILTTVIALVALCFVSSAGYIINDLADLKKDKKHPENKHRPLAAGEIKKSTALIVMLIFLMMGLYLGYTIGLVFLAIIGALFVLTQIYTFILKKVMLADVLTITTLFVFRAIAGAVAIKVVISSWLVLVPFFLSLFLSVGKRHANLLFLKEKASATREVLKDYNLKLTNSLMIMSTTLLVVVYALYSFQSPYNYLIHTLPFALFVIFRYYHLISSGSKIARTPEKAIRDKPLLIGTFLWIVVTVVLVYV
jgi:4-hydroxybenzoate polyprenyltransferase